jgi:RNA polymerase sigma factor (sigma-70 family)
VADGCAANLRVLIDRVLAGDADSVRKLDEYVGRSPRALRAVMHELARQSFAGNRAAREELSKRVLVLAYNAIEQRRYQWKNPDVDAILGELLLKWTKLKKEKVLGILKWERYLIRMANRCFFDWWRKQHKGGQSHASGIQLDSADGGGRFPFDESKTGWQSDWNRDPVADAQEREREAAVHRCLGRIGSRYAQVLWLTAKEYKHREIADQLDIGTQSVGKVYGDALKKLKNCIAKSV